MPSFSFSPSVKRTIAALVPVLCPPEVVELGLVDAITDEIERGAAYLPPHIQAGLSAGVMTYELGAVAYPRNLGRRASKLSLEAHDRYFESWLHGPTPLHRQFAKAIKQLICMACYDQPAIKESIGYRPQAWIDEVKRKRLAVFKTEIAKQEAAVLAPDPLPPLAELEKLTPSQRPRGKS